ncbi:hypothetical protein [Micromonospora sp. NBS 11-29]|nr:hypothetical protein [Micromonospora sp. NBS 11-29]
MLISFGLFARLAMPAIRRHACRYSAAVNEPRSTSSSGSWKYAQ